MKKKYHFIGIGGIGMSGLAQILIQKGCPVSGSDLSSNSMTRKLIDLGAIIHPQHSEENISADMTIVYSSDIPVHNPEYQAALRLGCPILHRADLLAWLMQDRKTLAVTGSHGKTTTSALLTTVLVEAGENPSFAVGGIVNNYQTNAAHGSGPYFVAEADESDGSFLKYHPYAAILTNCGNDHLKHYKTEEALMQAFLTFARQTKHLFFCGDDGKLKREIHQGISYGFNEDCALRASNFQQKGWSISFDASFEGKHYPALTLPMIGRHNALNALAVFGLALFLSIPEAKIRAAFAAFQGTKRRQEKKWETPDLLFIDDYAHHPTEIKETLKAIRSAVQGKLVAVYEPHRYSRIKDCLGSFGGVFDAADVLIVTDLYSAREKPIDGVSHEGILKEVDGTYVPRDQLASYLLNTQGVIVSLGAGGITTLSDELFKLL